MRKFLFISLMLLVPMQLFAAVKADQITTNNPTKAVVDFLKSIDVQTNDGMYLPSGTTAQRPAVPAKDGMLRYNQDSDQAEIYANGNWGSIGGGLAKWVTGKAYKVDDVIFNGTKIYKALLDHTSGVFATDLANGDWVELAQADLSNYVDRTTNQTVGGNKTLTGEFRVNNLARISGSLDVIQDTSLQGNVAVGGDLYVTGDTRLDLSMNGYVKAANGLLSAADLNLATDVTGILPIANGGTGASAKNFVDLTTNQSVAGNKTLTGETTFSNRVTMTGMVNIDRPAGIVKTDNTGNIEVGKIDLTDEVEKSLPQNNGGNGNLIPTNASFELSPVNTDWTCSAIVPSASSAAAVDGAQGITFTASSASQGCTRYVSMPEGNVGKLLEYSMYVKSTGGDVEVCSINDSVVSNCKTYTVGQSTDVVKVIVTDRPKNANTNANGILFRTKTATSTTFLGDLAYVGLPKSDEAIVAKFDNNAYIGTFSPIVITASSANPTAGGVTQNNIVVTQQGSYTNMLYTLKTTTGWTSGTGYYIFHLPIVNGVQLEFDDSVTTSANVGTGVILGSGGTAVASSGCAAIKNSASTFSVICDSPSSGNGLLSATFFSLSNANQWYSFSINAKIKNWSSQTNAAIVACKEGPLKCANTFTANITGTTISDLNIPGWIKTVTNPSTGVYVVTFADNLFTVAPTCIGRRRLPDATWSANGDYGSQGLTDATKTTLLSSSTQFAFNFFISCSKNAPDYNEAYERIVIQKDNADIRSTEWLTGGFNYINNKPIYKKCTTFATATTNATLATGTTSLLTVSGYIKDSGATNEYAIPYGIQTNTLATAVRNTSTGIIATNITGVFLNQPAMFCVEYTR